MNFPFYIARRYLFSKKSHNAINIISMIAMIGVAITTMAMICVLSVFNGFQDLVASCFTEFDPTLKVIPTIGKTFDQSDSIIIEIKKDKDVKVVCGVLEDKAMAQYGEKQAMITLMGVEDNFAECTDIQNILYGNGKFILQADVLNYGIPGIRLAMFFNMGTSFTDPIQVYTPRATAEVNVANPLESFNQDELNSTGVVFSVNQKKYDQEYLLSSLKFAQNMFEKPNQLSALELKLADGANCSKVQKRLQKLVGKKYKIANRYEQQEDVFRIMKTEKYMAYIFLTFILLTACFNIVGSLSMLIIDKRKDIQTLRDLGANEKNIRQIFLFEGRMISIIGAIIGIAIGVFLCLIQQEYGIITLGEQSGAFIVDSYPVTVRVSDIILTLITVLIVSFITAWYPVKYLSQKLTEKA